MIRRPPRSTRVRSSAASDVYKRQLNETSTLEPRTTHWRIAPPPPPPPGRRAWVRERDHTRRVPLPRPLSCRLHPWFESSSSIRAFSSSTHFFSPCTSSLVYRRACRAVRVCFAVYSRRDFVRFHSDDFFSRLGRIKPACVHERPSSAVVSSQWSVVVSAARSRPNAPCLTSCRAVLASSAAVAVAVVQR